MALPFHCKIDLITVDCTLSTVKTDHITAFCSDHFFHAYIKYGNNILQPFPRVENWIITFDYNNDEPNNIDENM